MATPSLSGHGNQPEPLLNAAAAAAVPGSVRNGQESPAPAAPPASLSLRPGVQPDGVGLWSYRRRAAEGGSGDGATDHPLHRPVGRSPLRGGGTAHGGV